MHVKVMRESGFEEAMIGLSLNKFQPVENMPKVASKLANKGLGHDKFLRQLQVWLFISAPISWWVEMDTYKIATVRQSSSTMHKPSAHIEYHPFTRQVIRDEHKKVLEEFENGEVSIDVVKNNIPSGLIMKSVFSLNYATINNIIAQRSTHRLRDWKTFIKQLVPQLEHPEFLISHDIGDIK